MNPGGGDDSGSRRRPVAGTVALWVLQVLLAGVFVMAALPEVNGDPVTVPGFDLLGLGIPGMIVVLLWVRAAQPVSSGSRPLL